MVAGIGTNANKEFSRGFTNRFDLDSGLSGSGVG